MSDSYDIYLGPLLIEDCDVLFCWINNRELVIKNDQYRPVHESSHKEWFNEVIKNSNNIIFAIRLKNDKNIIGVCQLKNIDKVNRSAELQIKIGVKVMRNKGIGTNSIQKLVDFGFKDLNLHRIYLYVFENNEIAIRVYNKLGFTVEGILREAEFINSEYYNIVIMSILCKDKT